MYTLALLAVVLVGLAGTPVGGQQPAVVPTPAEALLVAAFPELRQQRVTWTRTETPDGLRLEARAVTDPFAGAQPAALLEATAELDEAGLVTLAVSGPLTDTAPATSKDGSLLTMTADSMVALSSSDGVSDPVVGIKRVLGANDATARRDMTAGGAEGVASETLIEGRDATGAARLFVVTWTAAGRLTAVARQ